MNDHDSTPDSLDSNNPKDTKIPLKPIFKDNDITPDKFINDFEGLKDQIQKERELEANSFPVEIFPLQIQEIITATNECLRYPIDFISASMLYAVSIAIGNTHRIEIMKGYKQSATLYIVLVGHSGATKTHPLTFALNPIEKQDKIAFREYELNKQDWEAQERKGLKPIWKQHLISDFTQEALTDIHKFNKRGIGVYSDELKAWINNFNQYKGKGSEEQFWLSAWSNTSIRVNRKTSEPIHISLPFISVIGGIQVGILSELAKNRTYNGFLERLLFVAPSDIKKEYWSETQLDSDIPESWDKIITTLLDMPLELDSELNPQPEILGFTSEAENKMYEWQRKITDQSNNAEDQIISGIIAKIEQYALRFALILQLMDFACNGSDKQAISIEATNGAIKLAEYFLNSAIKAHSIMITPKPLLDKKPQAVYDMLPDYFTTSEGIQIALELDMTKRTFQRFIKNRTLFNCVNRGEYEKLF